MYLPKLPIVAIVFTAALAQAGYIHRRASSSFETLFNDLQNVTATTQQLNNSVNAYVVADGFSMLGPEAALRDALNQTTADCNNISAMLSDTESTALLNETSHFVTLFQSTAQNLIDKEPVFASIPLGNIFGSIFIPVIKARFISLDACLLSHIPSNMSATMQNYFNQLDSTCADVCTAFNVSCQLPSYEQ